MSVSEIEAAIAQLPPRELVELMAWLEQHHEKVWNEQIAEDLDAGRLDGLLAEVEQEYEGGSAQCCNTTQSSHPCVPSEFSTPPRTAPGKPCG